MPRPPRKEPEMSVTAMNHFTILTGDLPATLAFYEE